MSIDESLRSGDAPDFEPRHTKRVLQLCQCAGGTIMESIERKDTIDAVAHKLGRGHFGKMEDERPAVGFTCGLCEYSVFAIGNLETRETEALIMSDRAEKACIENVKDFGLNS